MRRRLAFPLAVALLLAGQPLFELGAHAQSRPPARPHADDQTEDEPITLGTVAAVVGIASGVALIWNTIRTCTSVTTCKWVEGRPQPGPQDTEKEKQKISVTTTTYSLGIAVQTGLPGDADPFLPSPGYDISDSSITTLSTVGVPSASPFVSHVDKNMFYHFDRLNPRFTADDTIFYDILKFTQGGFRRTAPAQGPESFTLSLSSPSFTLSMFDTVATMATMEFDWVVNSPELGTLFFSRATVQQGQMPVIEGDVLPSAFVRAPGKVGFNGFSRNLSFPFPPSFDSLHFTVTFEVHARAWRPSVDLAPPVLTDAYPVSANQIEVVFDRDVTPATATNAANYSLASFGSVNSAVMHSANAVILSITNGLTSGDLETVTVNGITGSAAGITMTTPHSRTLVNGLLSANEVQAADPDSLAGSSCVDRSRFAGSAGQLLAGSGGTRASVAAGIVSRYGQTYFLEDAGAPRRGGLALVAPPSDLIVGHRYRVTGRVREYFGETQLANIIESADLGPVASPSPISVSIAKIARNHCDVTNQIDDGEDFEGMLVRVPFVKVVAHGGPAPGNGFYVADQSYPDTMFVENLAGALTPNPPPNGELVSVTGHLHYAGTSFRLCPRDNSDIVDNGVTGTDGAIRELTLSVFPNPAQSATLSFAVPRASDVDLGIYDVAGRRVATVFRGTLAPGTYAREWSGERSDGRQAESGVYFVRIKSDHDMRAVRAIYLGR